MSIVRAQQRPISQPRTARPCIKLDAPVVPIPKFQPRYFHPGELDVLVYLMRSVTPRRVIEFGCNEGRAAAAILANLPGIDEYIGIDVLPGYTTHMKCQRKEIPALPGCFAATDPRFRLILRARGSFELGKADLPDCDVAFIDADHSRVGVMNDYGLAKSLVRPGGVIIFHDDNGLPAVQVSETLDELHARGNQITHVDGTWFAFERVPDQRSFHPIEAFHEFVQRR